jgi:primosomal protein N' (replication factor Y)
VRVPVGARTVVGCVIGHNAAIDAATEPRDVADILDWEPFLPQKVVELCRWVADYYMAGIGDAIGAALPPGARRASAYKTERVVYAGQESDPGSDPIRLTPRQTQVLDMLAAAPGGLRASALRARGVSDAVIRRLVARGLAVVREEPAQRDPFHRAAMSDIDHDPARTLTSEQKDALDGLIRLADAGRFHVALLHGVTGSGKTELYMRLALHVCAGGRQVLLMVPEIALTPSVVALFRSAFGQRVAIQHSGLSDGERHDQWQRIRGICPAPEPGSDRRGRGARQLVQTG